MKCKYSEVEQCQEDPNEAGLIERAKSRKLRIT